MPDTAISALPNASTLTGTEVLPLVQTGSTKKSLLSAIGAYILSLFEAPVNTSPYVRMNGVWSRTFIAQPYLSGNWYPPDIGLTLQAGGVIPANTIRMIPIVFYRDVTITDLAARVTTAVAANFQLAIYANDPSTGPTGPALVSTPAMSGAVVGAITSPVVTPATITAGVYWAAVLCDTSGLIFQTTAAALGAASGYHGSPNISDITSAATAATFIYLFAQTYGTWPNIPGTAVRTSTNGTLIQQTAAVFYKAQ